MTLIELLQKLEELFPEKWGWDFDRGNKGFVFWTKKDDETLVYQTEYGFIGYSTEDCDRILAEHGMVMWVEPSEYTCGHWTGFAGNDRDVYVEFCNSDFSTKRSATEATFLAALEYIIKTKEGK